MKANSNAKPVLAVDIGGTKILAALVTKDGKVLAKERRPTLASEGPTAVIDQLFATLDALFRAQKMTASQLHSISIACAGGIDADRGVVTTSPNLPGWIDVPLRDTVKDRYNVKTLLLNDSSAAALGEYRFGVGKNAKNFIMLTVGTGIGGGIILKGKLYNGTAGSAGELGHMTIDVNGPLCNCGNTGCLEMLASGTAMAQAARRRLNQGEKSALVDMTKGKIEDITAEQIGIAAQNGDKLSAEIIAEAAAYLGVGMVNLVNIFNPEVLAVGGGVSKLGDVLLEPARRIVKERAFPISARTVRIVTARLGDEAGVLGAAVFAFEKMSF
jgi:glucokinase